MYAYVHTYVDWKKVMPGWLDGWIWCTSCTQNRFLRHESQTTNLNNTYVIGVVQLPILLSISPYYPHVGTYAHSSYLNPPLIERGGVGPTKPNSLPIGPTRDVNLIGNRAMIIGDVPEHREAVRHK